MTQPHHEQAAADVGAASSLPQIVDDETAAAFISKRVKPQLAWFEANAKRAKSFHQSLSMVQLAATAVIPLVNLLAQTSFAFTIASTGLAAVAAIAIGWNGIAKHQDNWLRYRQTANGLSAMLLHYELKLNPYDGPDRHSVMIARTEEILSGEGAVWITQARQNAPTRLPRTPKLARSDED